MTAERAYRGGFAAAAGLALLATVAGATAAPAPAPTKGVPRARPQVIARYPHDRTAFTQGLLVHEGAVYESTGLRGRSTVRRVDVASGKILQRHVLPESLFGEGLARVEDRLIQLTWTAGRARIYSLDRLELMGELRYHGQGWGLCFDGEFLVMSDGSHKLTFRDPTTFEAVRVLEVRGANGPVRHLNELECVGRAIYANVWQTWNLVRIDRDSGMVTARIDASGLLTPAEKGALPPGAVLNGIAYDASDDTYLLTGKLWPAMFRVRFEIE